MFSDKMKYKAYIVFDKTNSSLKIKNFIEKKIQITSLAKSNVIIVLGGDGFMLQTLKKFYKFAFLILNKIKTRCTIMSQSSTSFL